MDTIDLADTNASCKSFPITSSDNAEEIKLKVRSAVIRAQSIDFGPDGLEDISSVTFNTRLAPSPENSNVSPTFPTSQITLSLRRYSKVTDSEEEESKFELSASAPRKDRVVFLQSKANRKDDGIAFQEGSTEPVIENQSHQQELFYLENEWTFWFDRSQKDCESSLCELGSFNTVQGFWAYWNNINISLLQDNCVLRLFKKGIKPLCEDPMNLQGGKWISEYLEKENRVKFWSRMVMLMIGEQSDDTSDNVVSGIVFAPRAKGDSIQLWLDGGHAVRTYGRQNVKSEMVRYQTLASILSSVFEQEHSVQWVWEPNKETEECLTSTRSSTKGEISLSSNNLTKTQTAYSESCFAVEVQKRILSKKNSSDRSSAKHFLKQWLHMLGYQLFSIRTSSLPHAMLLSMTAFFNNNQSYLPPQMSCNTFLAGC